MLLILLGIVLLIVGIPIMKFGDRRDRFLQMAAGYMMVILGGVISCLCLILFVSNNCFVEKNIRLYQLRHEDLLKKIEVVGSLTDDEQNLAKYYTIQDATEWNEKVFKYKYLSENIWTSCLYSKKVADSLKYIDAFEVDR